MARVKERDFRTFHGTGGDAAIQVLRNRYYNAVNLLNIDEYHPLGLRHTSVEGDSSGFFLSFAAEGGRGLRDLVKVDFRTCVTLVTAEFLPAIL